MNKNIALNILHVEDDAADAKIISNLIQDKKDPFYTYNITVVKTLGEALIKLKESINYNAVLLDLNLPDGNGVKNMAKSLRHALEILVQRKA